MKKEYKDQLRLDLLRYEHKRHWEKVMSFDNYERIMADMERLVHAVRRFSHGSLDFFNQDMEIFFRLYYTHQIWPFYEVTYIDLLSMLAYLKTIRLSIADAESLYNLVYHLTPTL